jgi:hypothetical protein
VDRVADVFTGSYISMEAEASSIRIHSHVVVPGLFQVPGYAREVITATQPGISAPDADRKLAARLAAVFIAATMNPPGIEPPLELR